MSDAFLRQNTPLSQVIQAHWAAGENVATSLYDPERIKHIWAKVWFLVEEEQPGAGIHVFGQTYDVVAAVPTARKNVYHHPGATDGMRPNELKRIRVLQGIRTEWMFLERDGTISRGTGPEWAIDALPEAVATRQPVKPAIGPDASVFISLDVATNPLPLPAEFFGRAYLPERGVGGVGSYDLENKLRLALEKPMFEAFRSHLDEEVLKTCVMARRSKGTKPPSANLYNLYAGQGAGHDKGALWRRQVVDVWPVLAPFLGRLESVVRAVDAGQPVLPALEAAIGVPQHVLKALKGAPFGTESRRTLTGVVEAAVRPKGFIRPAVLAASVPASWVPRTPQEWNAARILADLMKRTGLCPHVWDHPAEGHTPGLIHANGMRHDDDWASDEEQAAKAKLRRDSQLKVLADIMGRMGHDWFTISPMKREDETTEDHQARCARLNLGNTHLMDAGRAFGEDILAPYMLRRMALDGRWENMRAYGLHATAQNLGIQFFMMGRSPAASLLASKRHLDWTVFQANRLAAAAFQRQADGFGADAPAMENPETLDEVLGAPEATKTTGWERLGEDVVAPNGMALTYLLSRQALIQEGSEMNHCVGSYDWHCRSGLSNILSIRSPDGARRSTVELAVQLSSKNKPPVVQMVQHRSESNGKPSKEAIEAISWYLEAIREGEIALSAARLQEVALASSTVNPRQGQYQDLAYYHVAYMGWSQADYAARMGEGWETEEATALRWRRILGSKHRSFDELLDSLPEWFWHSSPDLEHMQGALVQARA